MGIGEIGDAVGRKQTNESRGICSRRVIHLFLSISFPPTPPPRNVRRPFPPRHRSRMRIHLQPRGDRKSVV